MNLCLSSVELSVLSCAGCVLPRPRSNLEDQLTLLGVTKNAFKLLRLFVFLFLTLHIFACLYWRVKIDTSPETVQAFLISKDVPVDVSIFGRNLGNFGLDWLRFRFLRLVDASMTAEQNTPKIYVSNFTGSVMLPILCNKVQFDLFLHFNCTWYCTYSRTVEARFDLLIPHCSRSCAFILSLPSWPQVTHKLVLLQKHSSS